MGLLLGCGWGYPSIGGCLHSSVGSVVVLRATSSGAIVDHRMSVGGEGGNGEEQSNK